MSVITVQSLTVKFGEMLAVKDLSFKTGDAQILAVVGPNGAGKTTLFNAITGFIKIANGNVNLDGESISGLPPNKIAQRGVIRTFQKRSFFPTLTVLENVIIGSHLANRPPFWRVFLGHSLHKESRRVEEAEKIIDYVGLSRRITATASNLAYGEQRLLGLAIALAAKPKILFLDEPCAGSNPTEIDKMMGLIRDVNSSGVSIILVEHHMRFVMEISDRIMCLSHGEKIYEGVPRGIKDCPGVVEAYLGGEGKSGAPS